MFSANLISFRRFIIGCAAAAAAFASGAATAAPPMLALPAATSAFLARFVDAEGNVNYAAIKRNPMEMNGLLKRVAAFDAGTAKAPEREAFYLNAYNLLVIGEIVAHYPLESVQKVPGFFDKNLLSVAGEKLTLNELEAQKLRQPYADPRLHFALVCGNNNCPRLSRTAYVGNDLFGQLNRQAKFALLDPNYVKIDEAGQLVKLSEIFKWYEADFSTSGKTGAMYVNQFRKENRVPTWFAVEYYAYNWSLNDQN